MNNMLKQKNLIKICMLVVIIGMISFSGLTFAADDTELLDDVAKIWHLVACVLSRIWIFFAQLAGNFLSNKWIYGELIGLDALLRRLWNLIKNFANFGLGFYFVYIIFKGLLDSRDKIENKLKDTLLWLLIAGIGIQSSWFFTAVVLDISTITLAATSSLSSQLVSLDETTSEYMFKSVKDLIDSGEAGDQINKSLEITLFPQNGAYNKISTGSVKLDSPVKKESVMDLILPNDETLSGPLYYLGFFVLRSTTAPIFQNKDAKTLKGTILNILIQCGTIMIYSLEMVVLLIVSIIRVVYIWIFIVLSPLVVLLWCIKQSGGKDMKFLGAFEKHFNFSSFFWNAFKPSIIVLGFSLAMIFASLMTKVVTESTNVDVGGVRFSSEKNADKYTSSVEGDVLSFTLRNAGKTLLELVVSIMTVILVYFIIKIAVNMGGGDFVSDKTKKIQNMAGDLLGSVPVAAVPGYDENGQREMHYITAKKAFGIGDNSSLLEERVQRRQNDLNDKNEADQRVVRSFFGDKTGSLSPDEVNSIKSAMTTGAVGDRLRNVKVEIDKIKDENGKGMILNSKSSSNNGLWMNHFGKWLTSMNGKQVTGMSDSSVWNGMILAWNSSQIQDIEEKLKEIFDRHPDRVRAYANFFGLDSNIDTWEELKEADISKK